MAVIGCKNRPFTSDELQKFCIFTKVAFEEGACGVSTGLAYYPASFGDTQEVVELCKIANLFDAPMSVHQRTVLHKPVSGFNPREEVLEFARKSGAKLQYSHYRTTPDTVGETEALLEPIRRGLHEGLRITADFYPYAVGSGYTAVILPMWVMEGGFLAIMQKIRNPNNRDRILREIRDGNPLLLNGIVTHMPRHPKYIGMSYREIAKLREQDVAEMLLDLLVNEELNIGYQLETNYDPTLLEKQEKDFLFLINQPFYMLGSDTLPGQMNPHPRSYGAFAKMIRLCVKYNFPLEILANRACALAARTFGLKNRGALQKQYYADLSIFDPLKVSDKSSFEDPKQYAVGMDAVIVNGKVAVENGKITGRLAGYPLRRGI
jgi:N-acyl-D-amino-acid deacylase